MMNHDQTGIDWEDAFSNMSYIPNGSRFPEQWAKRAASFREQATGELDIAYGDHPRSRLDLFYPTGTPKGLAVIIHGGYWLAFDKSSWSDLAEGALSSGWAVAMPSYTLAPEASLADMTKQIALAIQTVAQRISGPIRLAGHSAGGHLATRMICENTPLEVEVLARIERIVSISGLHDLRPLLLHSMNAKLGLDMETARSESPALCKPVAGAEVIAWVGANERPEFLRQSALLVESWREHAMNIQLVAEADRHHFNVIDGLKTADHPLSSAFIGS